MAVKVKKLLLVGCNGMLAQKIASLAPSEYSVEGVRGELKENVISWLGAEPATPEERSNFIASATERVSLSLKAIGYYEPEIAVEIDRSTSPWQMLVKIESKEPVRITAVDVRLEGDASADSAFNDVRASAPLLVDDVLHHGIYEELKKKILNLGQQRGYFDGEFTRSRVEVNLDEMTATIALHYHSGQRYRFGELRLDDTVMEMNWVESVLKFNEGDYFDLKSLQQLRSELQQTRFFSSVTVRPRLDELANGQVPVMVTVSPADRHNFEFGLGFSTDTEERVSVTWRTPILNRYGHSQETRLEYSSINPSGRFTYNIPLSHPLDDVLQLSAYLEDNEYGDLDSHQKGLRIRREIKKGQWLGSYSLRALDENWKLGQEHRENSYVLPGATLSHKSRSGSLVDPESGLHQVYLVEGGREELGSDIDLLRLYSNFRFVTPLAPRHRLVARAELGAVFLSDGDRVDLAPSLSFFAGGSQSIRGFAYQSIGNEVLLTDPEGNAGLFVVGGDRLLTASLEYQYYFNNSWRGAVFADGGDAFDEGEFDAHYGAGFGLHYMSPVGAIRLEVANDLSEDNPSWRLHVNIGAEF